MVEESYSTLQVGKILPETEGYRAMLEVIKIEEEKVDVFRRSISMGDQDFFDVRNLGLKMAAEMIEDKKKELLEINKDNAEYVGVFKKVCGWVEQGFCESGITIGAKVRFLKKKFEIKDEEELEKKRFNLKDIFKRK